MGSDAPNPTKQRSFLCLDGIEKQGKVVDTKHSIVKHAEKGDMAEVNSVKGDLSNL